MNIKAKGISIDPSASWSGEAGEAGLRFDSATGQPVVRKADGTEFSITPGGQTAPLVTPTTDGLARAADKAKLDAMVSAADYGAKGDGVTDDTAAIQAAVNAASVAGGGTILFGAVHKITDQITVSQNNIHIRGVMGSTKITFAPTSAGKSCFFFGGTDPLASCSIGQIRFYGAGSYQRTAIQFSDMDGGRIYDVDVDPAMSGSWATPDHGSVGIVLHGRQMTYVERIRIFADRPVWVRENPHDPIGADHLHLRDTYLRSTPSIGGACVFIDSNVYVMNLVVDGTNSWIVDKYGIYWNETGAPAVALSILLSNIRCEQAVDMTGTTYYIASATGIINLSLDNCAVSGADGVAGGQNGFYLKGVQNGTLRNCLSSTNDASKKHLWLDGCYDINLDNCYWQINTIADLGGMLPVLASPLSRVGAALPASCRYVNDYIAASFGLTVGDRVYTTRVINLSPATPAGATQAGRVFQGSGVPNNSDGNNGDVYFRTDTPSTTNQRIYIKASGSWVGIA